MTNIEKIRQARHEMDTAFKVAFGRTSRGNRALRVRAIDMEVLERSVHQMMAFQAEALRQATEVADENFERAQKLSEQVQENVRHIEALAGQRKGLFIELTECLGALVAHWDDLPEGESLNVDRARAALALAKGEAV